MRFVKFIGLVASLIMLSAFAEAKSNKNFHGFMFKWDDDKKIGYCANSAGREGLNPHYVGPCGDMRGLDLSDKDFSGLDLSGSNFDGVDLSRAKLNGATLRGIKARGTNFSKAHLNGTDFKGAVISGARFNRAKLNGVHMEHANLSGAYFKQAQFSGAQLQSANIGGANLQTNLETANFKGAVYSTGTRLNFDSAKAAKKGMVNFSKHYGRQISSEAKANK